MDETGFSIGAIKGAQVVVDTTLLTKYQAHPGRQEWVTVLECVSADGQSIPPFIILKGKNISTAWIPKKALGKEMHFACSSQGWTNNNLALSWLKNCFEPATREKASGKTRLLLCDGHESHVTSEFVTYCIQHNIFLHLLVPHSSHLLQPLDVGVFGPLKKAISTRLDQLLRAGVSRLEKVEWVEAYIEVREGALTVDNIRGGWRGAGIVPLNRVRVTHSLPAVIMRPTTPPPAPTHNSPFDNVIAAGVPPDAKVLRSTNVTLREKACKNELDTPARHYIPHLVEITEQLLAENSILQRRLADAEGIIEARKERKQGKRLLLKGTYGLSTMEIAAALKECEKATQSKKVPKGRGKKKEQGKFDQASKAASEDVDEEADVEGLEELTLEQL